MRHTQKIWAAILAAGTLTAGCVPYPVYKTLQPAARITVVDHNKVPLPGAEVLLIASAYPYGFEHSRTGKITDASGTATFDAVREMRVEVMALHGAEEFFWNWCVRKDGFTTYVTGDRSAGDFRPRREVQLTPGESVACPPARRPGAAQ